MTADIRATWYVVWVEQELLFSILSPHFDSFALPDSEEREESSEVGVGGGTVALITPSDIPREVASSF